MNRRMLLLLAAVWMLVMVLLLWMPGGLGKTGPMRLLYAPAIIAGLVMAEGSGHVLSPLGTWSGVVLWSLTYWTGLLVLYAVWIESRILRAALRRLRDPAEGPVTRGSDGSDTLHRVGRSLRELERRRRSHWLLAAIPELDPGQPDHVVGARAIHAIPGHRAVRATLAAVEQEMRTHQDGARVEEALRTLRADAQRMASPDPSPGV